MVRLDNLALKSGDRFFILLPLMLFMICFAIPSFGEEASAGNLTKVEGTVKVIGSDGREHKGEAGLLLFPGDQISTGKDSAAWLMLDAGGEFRLGEDAQIAIGELTGADTEDSKPVLRLVIGYLWSRIKRVKAALRGPEIQTSTAVIGIRGTEFDTVVSLDGTLAVAVDDGKVEVDTETTKLDLGSGKMIQIEYDGRAGPTEKAVPREKRDWKAWRKSKVERLVKNLPTAAPRFQRHFENAVQQAERFTSSINQKAEEIRSLMEELRRARAEKDRERIFQLKRRIQEDIQSFKNMVGKFRKAMNRVRAMGQLSRRVENLFEENRGKYSDQDIAVIKPSLIVIADKRTQLRDIFRTTVLNIKSAFKRLRTLKRESGSPIGQ